MERDYLKKQLKLRLIVYCALAILLYGAAAQFNTSVHGLIKRSDEPVKVLLLSSPPIFIAYNPEFKKAVVNNLPNTKKALSAQEILQKAKIEQDKVIIIDIRGQKRIEFWEKFKNNLQSWQKKPYIIFQYLYAYIKLKCEGKTDLSFGDFILISTELSTLQPSDFAVQNPLVDKIIKGRKQQEAAISITTDIKPNQTAKGPLIVEVLNASGKNGLAGEVTKFLRERNNSGILNVDVISYGNYPELLERSQILDNSSRLLDIQQTAYQLGLEDHEIFTHRDKNAISDVKIVLGKDFVLPKRYK
ncbi:LytR C-terminal domain-containing protein [Candidatus Proelusimicrobium volucris]|uniref:LytR C-terminal domain-containing protein n=1 Tax=Candidatus Proelusimicrobium volucris TaxID=3416225 RepID=UPI003D0ADD23